MKELKETGEKYGNIREGSLKGMKRRTGKEI